MAGEGEVAGVRREEGEEEGVQGEGKKMARARCRKKAKERERDR
jgi:hypothetical protein